MRAVDCGMAKLHHIYERLISWAFSGRRYRVFVPPVPAYGFGFDAHGQRLTTASATLRFATLTPRGIVLWSAVATFVARHRAGHHHRRRGDPADRPGLHAACSITMPVGTSLDARRREDEAGRGHHRHDARDRFAVHAGRRRQRPQHRLHRHRPEAAPRSASSTSSRSRTRSASALEDLPGISRGARQPADLHLASSAPIRRCSTRSPADLGAKIKKVKGVTDFESSVKPGLPAYAVRVRPDAARQLGLTPPQLAASLRAYVKATCRPTGRRPTASRWRCSCACPRPAARASRS